MGAGSQLAACSEYNTFWRWQPAHKKGVAVEQKGEGGLIYKAVPGRRTNRVNSCLRCRGHDALGLLAAWAAAANGAAAYNNGGAMRRAGTPCLCRSEFWVQRCILGGCLGDCGCGWVSTGWRPAVEGGHSVATGPFTRVLHPTPSGQDTCSSTAWGPCSLLCPGQQKATQQHEAQLPLSATPQHTLHKTTGRPKQTLAPRKRTCPRRSLGQRRR